MLHTKSLVLLLVLLAMLMLAACGGSSAPTTSGEAISLADLPINIDVKTVDLLRGRDDVIILDVREDWEYAAGHIPGTVLIPLGQLGSRLSEIPADKTVIAVCRSGNRSGQATQLLKQSGFTVHNMEGGMLAWEQANYAVER
ncbi:MAG: rhodanese-like domain-containing protein [Caldilineaceae bacterium]|nr:rhodanese-like domain-containing protein [Caldilineaceae bacterium]